MPLYKTIGFLELKIWIRNLLHKNNVHNQRAECQKGYCPLKKVPRHCSKHFWHVKWNWRFFQMHKNYYGCWRRKKIEEKLVHNSAFRWIVRHPLEKFRKQDFSWNIDQFVKLSQVMKQPYRFHVKPNHFSSNSINREKTS